MSAADIVRLIQSIDLDGYDDGEVSETYLDQASVKRVAKEIIDWHKAELKRVIGEDDLLSTRSSRNTYWQKIGKNLLRQEQRKRAGL